MTGLIILLLIVILFVGLIINRINQTDNEKFDKRKN